MKQIVINLGDKLEIVSKDITIGDVIKAMALFTATIKEVSKENKDISYNKILEIVDTLSDEIISEDKKSKEQ